MWSAVLWEMCVGGMDLEFCWDCVFFVVIRGDFGGGCMVVLVIFWW